MKIAVKSEVIIPISNVVANPFIGPVPNVYKISAVSPVVMFASNIEDKAFENPSLTDSFKPLPLISSSRTRSYISTFASTAIPIVNTIPAIPGRVSTAPKPESIPKINKILSKSATFE